MARVHLTSFEQCCHQGLLEKRTGGAMWRWIASMASALLRAPLFPACSSSCICIPLNGAHPNTWSMMLNRHLHISSFHIPESCRVNLSFPLLSVHFLWLKTQNPHLDDSRGFLVSLPDSRSEFPRHFSRCKTRHLHSILRHASFPFPFHPELSIFPRWMLNKQQCEEESHCQAGGPRGLTTPGLYMVHHTLWSLLICPC